MEERGTWVNSQGVSSIKCPSCGLSKKSAVGTFKGKGHKLTIYCACGTTFQSQLDFRRARRKRVKLTGFYSCSESRKFWNYMFISDLSLTGIGFKTVNRCDLQPGDTLKLMFTLDDSQATVVEKEAMVVHANDEKVGCEFANSYITDDILGRYLVPE